MAGSVQRKNILVTGGAGFIGAASADALLKNGEKVIIIDEVRDPMPETPVAAPPPVPHVPTRLH